MKKLYLFILIISTFANAQISQVKDIYSGATAGIQNSGNPTNLFDFNGTLLFRADDGTAGVELWKSDGTNSGTVQVKDIANGATNSNPSNFTFFKGAVFFNATTGTSATGSELYKTDGTAAGTSLVKDIRTGTASSNPSDLTVINPDMMVFGANDGTLGVELWKTDGTATNTVNIVDYAGTTGSITWIKNLLGTAICGQIVGATGREIYKSDGTVANSSLVYESFAGTSSGAGTTAVVFNNEIYYGGDSGTTGFELWKTNGTATGTVLVKEILTGTTGSAPKRFAVLGNNLYFYAIGSNGAELWKTDGTTTGTTEVADINPSTTGSNPDQIAEANGAIYYFASDNNLNYDLYKFDGTTNIKLLDSNALTATITSNFVTLNGLVYFAVDSNSDGNRELWQTDGTAAGTQSVVAFSSSAVNPVKVNLITLSGNKIFFSAETTDGTELFVYNPVNLSVANNNFLNDLKVYPNPTNGILTINYNFKEKANYDIFDVVGKKIIQGEILSNQIEMNLTNGIYLLKIETENKIFYQKVIRK